MSSSRRCSWWTSVGSLALALALASSAAATGDSAITLGPGQTALGNVALEVYDGRLDGGRFALSRRGYASLVVDDAPATTMFVRCLVTPHSPTPFVVAESRRTAAGYEATGQAFELPPSATNLVEFAVTPEHAGDHAYSIRPKDRSSFGVHSCTVEGSGASSSSSANPLPLRRISPSQTVSGAGELELVEAEFYKWLRNELVFDIDQVMTLAVGPSAPDPVVVRCDLDLDLAARTTFEIEIVERQATISKRVEADGQLVFTLWGGKRARISNPTHMWIWRSCELDG